MDSPPPVRKAALSNVSPPFRTSPQSVPREEKPLGQHGHSHPAVSMVRGVDTPCAPFGQMATRPLDEKAPMACPADVASWICLCAIGTHSFKPQREIKTILSQHPPLASLWCWIERRVLATGGSPPHPPSHGTHSANAVAKSKKGQRNNKNQT